MLSGRPSKASLAISMYLPDHPAFGDISSRSPTSPRFRKAVVKYIGGVKAEAKIAKAAVGLKGANAYRAYKLMF